MLSGDSYERALNQSWPIKNTNPHKLKQIQHSVPGDYLQRAFRWNEMLCTGDDNVINIHPHFVSSCKHSQVHNNNIKNHNSADLLFA